jgi:hypothetical protein
MDPSRWSRDILYPQTLALTAPTSGGRSVVKVRLRTKATEFSLELGLKTPKSKEDGEYYVMSTLPTDIWEVNELWRIRRAIYHALQRWYLYT